MVIERVGSGAMGVVYGAYDPELDRKVALKLLKPGQGVKEIARARLLREAKAMARLSHPNVVAVHDVGVFEDQVFLAMEFLNAGTIKSWLAEKPRSWREILKVFIRAGRGLEAAHAAGLVHRDFKPDNVLLDKDGRPRVVDFGIARQASGGSDDDSGAGEAERADLAAQFREAIRESSGQMKPLLTLTKTGTWVGTPAYMAPEQFMGERGDEKSDQFSFCVALYEALYGERPFAGEDVLTLSVNVTQETFKPLPKDRGVPAWLRRVIVRGVRSNPTARWESMAALIAALEDDPAVKLRRRLIVGGTVLLVGATFIVAHQMVTGRRAEAERRIARHVEEGRTLTAAARRQAASAGDLRRRAFLAFDTLDRDGGEALWRQARALVPLVDAGYDQAAQAFETAFVLDQSQEALRGQIADVHQEHLLFAEEFRLGNKVQVLAERLAAADLDGRRRKALAAPGALTLRTTPIASRVVLERYDRDAATGRRVPVRVAQIDAAHTSMPLPPGSYRLVLDGPGLAHVLYPFEVDRGRHVELDLALPAVSEVPEGFVYVAPGEFWFGDADEQLRTQFFGTVPIHRRRTEGYLIARRETTYREWIAFLDALPENERDRNLPDVSVTTRGSVRLRPTGEGWQLVVQPSTTRYVASAGDPISYLGRKQRERQDWLRFPVAGISRVEAENYFRWLRRTRKLPGARLCTEAEWERAARGADDRLFPHGDELAPDEANIDATYGRVDSAYGPDEVGSHPASTSPFGVDDLAGNVFDLATSSLRPDEIVIRGGAYFFQPINSRSTNREVVPTTYRDVASGIRVCVSLREGT